MSDFNIIKFGLDHDGQPVAGVYANDPCMIGPYGTYLLFRGTPSQCEKQAARWEKRPDELDPLLFQWRQQAIAERRNRKPIPLHPAAKAA